MRLTKLAIPAQQKRISAQQATGIQQAPGGGFRLAGEETVLIPAPGAYPLSLSAESAERLHQGLRVVYVLAQYMPKYLEVSVKSGGERIDEKKLLCSPVTYLFPLHHCVNFFRSPRYLFFLRTQMQNDGAFRAADGISFCDVKYHFRRHTVNYRRIFRCFFGGIEK